MPLTLPGEQARVRITDDKRGYATAEAEEIVTPSPERIAPACRHSALAADATINTRATRLNSPSSRPSCAKRSSAEACSAGRNHSACRRNGSAAGAIAIASALPLMQHGNPGYRGRRSHAVVPIAECPIAAPLLVAAAAIFADVARQFSSALRPTEISLFSDADESRCSRASSPPAQRQDSSTSSPARSPNRFPRSKAWNLSARPPVTASHPVSRAPSHDGAEILSYRAAGFDYRVDHGAFFQVNRWLVDGSSSKSAQATAASSPGISSPASAFSRVSSRPSFASVIAVESAPPAIARP